MKRLVGEWATERPLYASEAVKDQSTTLGLFSRYGDGLEWKWSVKEVGGVPDI